MRVAIGSDHGGFRLKKSLIELLKNKGFIIADMGTHSDKPCDYPLVGERVAKAVSNKEFDRGILICKSGIGMSMAANKVSGIRAALCRDVKSAISSKEHNNANVLVLSASYTPRALAGRIVNAWFSTEFAGGRHARRVRQMSSIERRQKRK